VQIVNRPQGTCVAENVGALGNTLTYKSVSKSTLLGRMIMFRFTLCLLSMGLVGLVGLAAPVIAVAATPVVCGVTSIDKAKHSFACKESSGRSTTFQVNAASKFTLNGAPMTSGMNVGDKCSVLVKTPPFVSTADCKR
jgi:hypothetical protein